MFFGDYSEFFKNAYIKEHLQTADYRANFFIHLFEDCKIGQHSQENTRIGVSFLINIVAGLAYLYSKRGSGTGVFLSVI